MTIKFITFEGPEGSGKSTQVKLLQDFFSTKNLPSIITREPGGTKNAEVIRDLVVKDRAEEWAKTAELLLYLAARNEHVEKVIKPALRQGKMVICDRFCDSTTAYQGYGNNMDINQIEQLNIIASSGIKPDLTFVLDIDPKIGIKRSVSRHNTETRYESMNIEYHIKVREGFLKIAQNNPKTHIIIDANQDIKTITQQINKIIITRL